MTETQHFIFNLLGVRILVVLTFATVVILAGFTLIEVGLAAEPPNEQIVKQNKLQKDTSDDSSTVTYFRQDGSALCDCPRCNFRDANPSKITEHLESWHRESTGGKISFKQPL
jgi:hypothetical protein